MSSQTNPHIGRISRNAVSSVFCFAAAVVFGLSAPCSAQDQQSSAAIFSAQESRDQKTRIPQQVLNGLLKDLDVAYARYGDRVLQMDIYRPKITKKALPTIVCIHGGGWAKGNRRNHARVAQILASRGFVAATISYRLSGEKPFPAAIHDCKAAVRFLRANASRYQIDGKKIGAIGLSAGGHLTALLATSGKVKELEGQGGNPEFSSVIQAAVPMGAQTDFLSERIRNISAVKDRGKIWRQFLGGTQQDALAAYKLASPLTHLDQDDPPCWFITGEQDDPSTRASRFRKQMEQFQIANGISVIQGAPHPFLGKQIWFDQMTESAVKFFEKHLK